MVEMAGSDGSNGTTKYSSYSAGKGQGTTTREFGESTGKRYAAGGKGLGYRSTGHGVDGAIDVPLKNSGSAEQDGIVVIRNRR